MSAEMTLPEEWISTQLGQAIDYGKCEKINPDELSSETWVLELEDIEKDSSKIIQTLTFSERQSKSTKNIFNAGNVLYGKLRPYLNKVVIAKRAGVCTTEIIPLDGGKYLHNNYLFHWLKHPLFTQYVTTVGYGVNMPRLGTKEGNEAPFVLAPLAEQQQIAQRLDELLAQVDTIKARLNAIPAILKRFRQSVLSAAVSGKLTEEWRSNNNYTDPWLELKVKNIVTKVEAGKSLKCIETPPQNDEYGIIKISAVTWGIFDENESKTLPNRNLFIEDRRVNEGDFLISRANTIELLGNPVIVEKVTKNLMLSDKVLRLVMDDKNKKWLSLFLRSSVGRYEIESRSTGNQLSMRNIGQSSLLDIDLPKPSDKEQEEIVRRVDQFFTFADQIEQRVNDAKARVDKLTQSILAKAFRGELTADWRAEHPELISGENSAEALLAKIQAAKAALEGKKKKGKAA
jgi:type I restriction enzyme S subunit